MSEQTTSVPAQPDAIDSAFGDVHATASDFVDLSDKAVIGLRLRAETGLSSETLQQPADGPGSES